MHGLIYKCHERQGAFSNNTLSLTKAGGGSVDIPFEGFNYTSSVAIWRYTTGFEALTNISYSRITQYANTDIIDLNYFWNGALINDENNTFTYNGNFQKMYHGAGSSFLYMYATKNIEGVDEYLQNIESDFYFEDSFPDISPTYPKYWRGPENDDFISMYYELTNLAVVCANARSSLNYATYYNSRTDIENITIIHDENGTYPKEPFHLVVGHYDVPYDYLTIFPTVKSTIRLWEPS